MDIAYTHTVEQLRPPPLEAGGRLAAAPSFPSFLCPFFPLLPLSLNPSNFSSTLKFTSWGSGGAL